MSSPPIGSSFFHAAAAVEAVAGVPFFAVNCTISKSSAGRFVVTLEQGIDAAESVIELGFINLLSIGDRELTLIHVSDTVKEVNILSGNPGVTSDQDFNFAIERIRTGA